MTKSLSYAALPTSTYPVSRINTPNPFKSFAFNAHSMEGTTSVVDPYR